MLALVAQLSALNISCRASELTDLGDGLSYLRVQSFDESAKDLSAAIREREFLIVDLRHAATTADRDQARIAHLGQDHESSLPVLSVSRRHRQGSSASLPADPAGADISGLCWLRTYCRGLNTDVT